MMHKLLSYLGHGRALEFFLGWLKINISLSIALSDLGSLIPATADLAWYYSPTALATPFFIMGILQSTGVMLNVCGYEKSWTIRAVGAVLAIFVWCLVLVKSSLVGEATLAVPIALTCLPASAFLFYKAWNRLPIPGSAGLT